MLFKDLPDDYDFQRLIDENEQMHGILTEILLGCQQDEKGNWITIKQLTPNILNKIKEIKTA